MFRSTHFWITHFQHCNKSWVTTSSHGISNHSTSFLMRETIIGLSDLHTQYVAHTALRNFLQQDSSIAGWLVCLSDILPLNFPIVSKFDMFALSLFVLAVCFSYSGYLFQLFISAQSLIDQTYLLYILHIQAAHQGNTHIISSICFVSDSRTLCNILLYAGVHSCYLIIYRELWLKIPYLLCLVFIRRTSSTFLCFL